MKPTAQPPKPISPVRRLGAAFAAITAATISTTTPGPTVPAVPFERWPVWAKDIAQSRKSQDIGIGDTLVHIIGDTRSAEFKTWFKDHIGTSCGCAERQKWLNSRFPYNE